MNDKLSEKLSNLPVNPGVYMFKDARDQVIYVGKAKRIRNRVKSYFQDTRNHSGKTLALVRKIQDVELFVTDTEAEALILENNLIKKFRPRYNISYRDDKTLPYICVTPGERPRVFPTRTVIKDGSRYFGPYDHVGKMRNMLEVIRKAFNLCTCAVSIRTIDRSRGLPKWHSCFEEYVSTCSAELPDDIYTTTLQKVVRLLNGKTEGLIRELRDEMDMAATELQFEEAARLRDGIVALEKYSEKMKVVSADIVDRDIFALEVDNDEGVACGVMFRVRDGRLLGRLHKFLYDIDSRESSEMLQAFVEDYYTGELGAIIPDEVHVSHDLTDPEPLTAYLWQEHGKKVPLIVPKIGEKAQMIRMAQSNARLLIGELALQRKKAEADRIPHSVRNLQQELRLSQAPRRIECFDNSNLQGTDPVASMVVFVDGVPKKSDYKRFKIRTVTGADDFASMREVLTRRYGRLKREGGHLPDLIVVDGGKGQLSSSVEALKDVGVFGEIPIIGLAKRLEEVFVPYNSDALMLPKTSSGLKLLQRVRDEAHRFAINFHRDLRSKRTFTSSLTEIEGVGTKSAQKLLKHFGSAKRIAEATQEELINEAGKHIGSRVYAYFHHDDEHTKIEYDE
ncbi:MAG: excinuclease ABC subunit C [Bacteroidetes bacterium]|nr:excinuclease ABC subunit C [Bacteroidota bacterium]MCH8523044.1 excinuclease ABC subunit UvrC [Balneolales bacterium]